VVAWTQGAILAGQLSLICIEYWITGIEVEVDEMLVVVDVMRMYTEPVVTVCGYGIVESVRTAQ
jgi:hypothetical protein